MAAAQGFVTISNDFGRPLIRNLQVSAELEPR